MRRRTRRMLKWAGLVGCVILTVAWGLNMVWGLVHNNRAGTWAQHAGIFSYDSRGATQTATWEVINYHQSDMSPWSLFWFYKWPRIIPSKQSDHIAVVLPNWCVLLPLAVFTTFLWRADGRCPPGHCQSCGYDLTGNESGTCPECGVRA